jgi:hypothetical protein
MGNELSLRRFVKLLIINQPFRRETGLSPFVFVSMWVPLVSSTMRDETWNATTQHEQMHAVRELLARRRPSFVLHIELERHEEP